MSNKPQNIKNLFSEVKRLIEEAKQNVAKIVNTTTTVLYWNVGAKINSDILGNKRAEYGKEIVKSLSRQLTLEYGERMERTTTSTLSTHCGDFPG